MTKLDEKAVSILNVHDSKFYLDMVDPLQIGIAETVIAYDDAVLINIQGIWMFMAQSEKRTVEFSEYIKKHPDDGEQVCIHNLNSLDVTCDILHLKSGNRCYVAARFSKEKFKVQTDAEIKKLTHQHDNLVWKTYRFFKDHDWGLDAARYSIEKGMFGAFKDGECVGFIGTHTEGTMGLLEILPEYRRRGYGEALEMTLANEFMNQGRIPYCHVIETNEASLSLQRNLGFWISEGKLVDWLEEY